MRNWTAAVLCTTISDGACNKLGCYPGHFRVVFISIDDKEMFASVYSSDSTAWSEATSTQLTYDRLNWEVLPALAGNAHYMKNKL